MSLATFPVRKVVLFKHGVGHFEREGKVEGDATLPITFKQSEVSDVLKSLTVLDLDGGHVASVSYDSTKPLEQLLAEVALDIPDQGSLVGLLPQIKGAKVRLHTGVSDPIEGIILGIDGMERSVGDAVVKVTLVTVLTESGEIHSHDLHTLAGLQILDAVLRKDLDYYLKTLLSAKKKDSRIFTFFAQGTGIRTLRLTYTLEAPVWKATYRILLGGETGPMIQGWAVVDNTQDEDWVDVELSLVSGLPVSFRHDLYTPRYIRRPEVQVQETTGVLPPEMEQNFAYSADAEMDPSESVNVGGSMMRKSAAWASAPMATDAMKRLRSEKQSAPSSMPAQVRERKIGDLFEYEIEHPVTIRRNQSALVPIVLRGFDGKTILLYNKVNRADNPLRCVEMKNTTGLTLEGGPLTVIDAGSYVGEAMLDTTKPDEKRIIAYAVELSVHVLDNVKSFTEKAHRVVIRKGVFSSQAFQIEQTTYQFDNKGDESFTLCLEHPRGGSGWELVDTAVAEEVTESYWRFRLKLEPRKTMVFVVRKKSPTKTVRQLTDFNATHLQFWLEQKYLNPATDKALCALLTLQYEATAIQESLNQLEKERVQIHQEQVRIRENLQTLGDRPSEKELRERFVRAFGTQEDRLEQIDRESKEKTKQHDACREKINRTIEKLEYEAAV